MTYALLVCGLICAALFVFVRDCKGGAKALALKTVASLMFILTAASAFIENPVAGALPVFVIVGMAFSLGGDVMLDLKITYPQDERTYTVSGMCMFAVTQICYTGALAIALGTHWAVYVGAIGAAAAIMCGCVFALKLRFGKYLALSCAYSFTLCMTVAQALFALVTSAGAFSALFFAGAVLFLISDGLLSLTYFGGKNSKAVIAANHTCYYLAQYSIAFALFFL